MYYVEDPSNMQSFTYFEEYKYSRTGCCFMIRVPMHDTRVLLHVNTSSCTIPVFVHDMSVKRCCLMLVFMSTGHINQCCKCSCMIIVSS